MRKLVSILILFLGSTAIACPDIRGVFQCEDLAGPFQLYVNEGDPEEFIAIEYYTEGTSPAALVDYSIYRGYELGPDMPADEYQIRLNYHVGSVIWSSERPFAANNSGIYQSVAGSLAYQVGVCHYNRVTRYMMTRWDRVFKTDWITHYTESFILSEDGYGLNFVREYGNGFKNEAACRRVN